MVTGVDIFTPRLMFFEFLRGEPIIMYQMIRLFGGRMRQIVEPLPIPQKVNVNYIGEVRFDLLRDLNEGE